MRQLRRKPRLYLGFVVLTLLAFHNGSLNAAPLENGFALAPKASATPAEKAEAYREARSRLIATAGKYEHTPYRYGGIDRNGLDCSGLVYLSFREALGISVPRNAESLYAWAEKIPVEDAQPGDLLFFATTGNGRISHVGIFTGNRKFIHSASEGPVTGVMYSSLDERYWSRTFAGAGRALPEAEMGIAVGAWNHEPAAVAADAKSQKSGKERDNVLIGVAAAPTWNIYYPYGKVFRGAAGQFRLGIDIRPLGLRTIIGMELRPEWDSALGVFRLPITVSWGIDDKLRIFAGPAVSFGDAELTVSGGSRTYTGGTSWIGAAGITAAPFILKVAQTDLAPYGELAWQSYFTTGTGKNHYADFSAAFRLSTGIRITWRV